MSMENYLPPCCFSLLFSTPNSHFKTLLNPFPGDVHFFVQSVQTYSPTMIVAKNKSITAREIFAKVPSVKKEPWGGEFWTDGYFVSTVSEHANEDVIRHYARNQGRTGEYKQLHKQKIVHHEQLTLF